MDGPVYVCECQSYRVIQDLAMMQDTNILSHPHIFFHFFTPSDTILQQAIDNKEEFQKEKLYNNLEKGYKALIATGSLQECSSYGPGYKLFHGNTGERDPS